MPCPSIVIVSPALAAANNGNWQTAQRWGEFLRQEGPARVVQRWPDDHAAHDEVMLALHARRSAESIRAWSLAHPGHGLAVVLTGTDLYRDIAIDVRAQESLQVAQRLVVLQESGVQALAMQFRAKTRVIFQSTTELAPVPKPATHLQAVMVGHLRDVKSPQTLFDAARLLRARRDIRIDHVGEAQEPGWAERAGDVQAACPGYRWRGPLPHDETRHAIREAHVLVHTSAMEGGAHVIMEAIRSGTPVLASRVDGNVGMLGADYQGYFEHGDAEGLAALLVRCAGARQPGGIDHTPTLMDVLRAQCAVRAPLFAPEAERAALVKLVKELHNL